MQLRNALKELQESRFTNEEKNIRPTLYKRFPYVYRYLCTFLTLLSVVNVKGKVDIEDTEINSNVTDLLKKCMQKMLDDKKKVQLLMWDETFLKTELLYVFKIDEIIGFKDFGEMILKWY